jgi:hypothetical protein
LARNRDKLDAIAAALVEREVLDDREIEQLIGPAPHWNGNGRSFSTPASAPEISMP